MIILGTNSVKAAGGFNVANSCRFNRADSPNLTKTPSSSGDLRKWTWSCWVKRSSISNGSQTMFNAGSSANNQIRFDSDDTINFYQWNSGYAARLATNQKFRDVSAWYHIVAHWDTGNGTAGDRMKLFVNGTEVTSFATDTNPSQNLDSYFGASGTALYVGDKGNGNEEMDGYLAEVVFIDGQNLAPDQFGEFDEDSGIWKPIDVSGLTFGTNGFYLDFKASANLGNDANGGTDFTENNITALDQSTDTCTNNFATLNPINLQTSSPPTLSEGNLTIASIADNDNVAATFSGEFKWYYEAKILQNPDGSNGYGAGAGACHIDTFNYAGWKDGNRTGFINSDTKWYSNSLSGAGRFVQGDGDQVIGSLTQATAGDIVGVACDSANGRVYIHINGTYQNSGDPAGGTGFIGGVTAKTGIWFPWFSSDNTQGTLDVNFGSPSFAISSGNTDGNGFGNFEYAVPSGFFSLNTKNLAKVG